MAKAPVGFFMHTVVANDAVVSLSARLGFRTSMEVLTHAFGIIWIWSHACHFVKRCLHGSEEAAVASGAALANASRLSRTLPTACGLALLTRN